MECKVEVNRLLSELPIEHAEKASRRERALKMGEAVRWETIGPCPT